MGAMGVGTKIGVLMGVEKILFQTEGEIKEVSFAVDDGKLF